MTAPPCGSRSPVDGAQQRMAWKLLVHSKMMIRNQRLIPLSMLVALSTGGCATMREHPTMCKVGAGLLGATLGGVGGGVGVKNIEVGPDRNEVAAGAGVGALAGGLIGVLVGHFACAEEAPAPPPPVAVAPPQRPVPGTKLVELRASHFDFNKAVLKPEGKARVGDAVALMDKDSGLRVSVDGHTDSVGSDAYNMKLSMRRAKAVEAYMVHEGVRASRIDVHPYGESRPVANNATEEGRAQNRRVEIIAE